MSSEEHQQPGVPNAPVESGLPVRREEPPSVIASSASDDAAATRETEAEAEAKAKGEAADDKSHHTHRKRRLTLETHALDASAASSAGGAAIDDPLDAAATETATAQYNDYNSPLRDENEKSKTFRKRRLTLTKHQVQTVIAAMAADTDVITEAAVAAALDNDVNHNNNTNNNNNEQPASKKRRMSEMSHTSNISTCSAESRFGSKIHHAGEILRVGTSLNSQRSRLYAPPHNLEQYDAFQHRASTSGASPSKKQPTWRRRMTRRPSEDDRKLPFPRNIVGQYSCHGIEPVYDSDYEHEKEEGDDDDDDDWLNEIPHQNENEQNDNETDENDMGSNNGGKNLANYEQQEQTPKVTTSAKINQDRGGIAFPYGNTKKTALFAVYDGHGQGGELVSQYALHRVEQKLKKHVNFNDNIEKAFKETFVTVDEELKDEPTIEPLYAGTTACVMLLRNNTITISNAGDSRAVLARLKKDDAGWDTIPLSRDQNPDDPDEQERIEYCGGYVSPPPEPGLSARVWLDSDCTQIGLAMSRSIGDHAVKPVGVIAEPVVTQHTIREDDDFLILASDGVWEFISSQEGVEIVSSNLHKGASSACQALIEAAANKWHQEEGDYRDDITALVIRLQKIWDHSIV